MEWCASSSSPGTWRHLLSCPCPRTPISLGRAWERGLNDGMQSFQLQSRAADLEGRGGSAGLCELRVRVNYILPWGPLLPSRKAGKRLGRPVRLPHSAEGCLDPGGCLHGALNPESHTWAPASAALSARWTCWGHTGAFTSDIQEGTKQEPGQDISSSTTPPPPKPVWDGFQVRYPSLREGTFRIPNGCRKG